MRTIRALLVLLHGGFGLLCAVIRPNLFEVTPGYSGLFSVMPTREWGYMALAIAVAVFVMRRTGPLQVLSQLASGGFISLIVVGLVSSSGLTPGGAAYSVFGLASVWALYRVFGLWLDTLPWLRRWQAAINRWRGRRG